MTRDEMLTEHLNGIYVLNELDLNVVKTKSQDIIKSAKSGNILALNNILSKLKNINPDQIVSISRKKFPQEFKSSEKYINTKNKKLPSSIKNPLIVARTSLLKINKEAKDPELQGKMQEALKKFDNFIARINSHGMLGVGLSMVFLAVIISSLIEITLSIAPIVGGVGTLFIAGALFIYALKAILNIFVSNKKQHIKVIK